jgi:hypothetical protein
MSERTSTVKSGVAWIVLSPIALLMALISTVGSLTVYYVQVALFGIWAVCGVISGIGKIAKARWASRLQIVLSWIAFIYCAVFGVLIAGYALVGTLKQKTGAWVIGIGMAVGVFLTGLPFLYLARRYKRQYDQNR